MIEGKFDSRTLLIMEIALDQVCKGVPRGDQYSFRKRIARQMIKCAESGRTTPEELVAAAQQAAEPEAIAR
ncbi:MAG: hypothetical protein ABW151_00555 [Pseudorhodoplanes sp.]